MSRILFYILFYIFGLNFISGQIYFTAKANQTDITLDDRIRIDFNLTIKDDVQSFDESIVLPDFENFEVLNHGSSESSRYINGEVSREINYQILLRPTKNGNLQIKPATVKINGKLYKTQNITIKVSGNGSNPTPKKNQNSVKPNRETFVKFEIDNSNPYLNESILGSLVLYTKNYTVLERVNSIITPNFKGVTIVPIQSRQKVEQVEKFGEVYIKATVAEYVMYPIRLGNVQIPAFKIGVVESDGFFNDREIELNSDPIQFVTKSLPQNQPKNFSGAVGEFTMNISSDKNNLSANTSANIEVEIIGNGNFKLLKTPEIDAPEEIESFSPNLRESFQATTEGLKGKIVSKTVIVPNYGGKFEVKTEPFTFFNPDEEIYKTISPEPIQLNVEGDLKPKDEEVVSSKNKLNPKSDLDSESKSSDFSFFPAEKIEKINESFDNTNLLKFGIPILFVLISLAGYFIYMKKKKELDFAETTVALENSPTQEIFQPKEQIINAKTTIPFKELDSFVLNNQKNEYYSNLEKILKQIAQNTNLNAHSGIELENEMLKNFGEIKTNQWKELILKCQIEKYSPLNDSSNLEEIHKNVKQTLTQFVG